MRGSAESGNVVARVAGVLFITATAASLLSTSLLNPVLNGSGYLAKIFAHQDRVIVGVSVELLAAFSSAAIAISLYPVLARHRPGLALGSVGFRLIEGVLYVVGAIGALLLVTLSQQAASTQAPGSPYFSTTGALLRALRDQTSLAAVRLLHRRPNVLLHIFPDGACSPVAVGLGSCRGDPGIHRRDLGPVPRDRVHVRAPGPAQHPDRRQRDGLGRVAHRQGVQVRCPSSRAAGQRHRCHASSAVVGPHGLRCPRSGRSAQSSIRS
jgi:Domain of unknown function (DUF4386)